MFFSSFPPFSDLPPGVAADAAERACVDFCPAGTRLFSRGERVRDLLLIQSGGVRLSRPGGDGQPVAVDYLGEGEAVGAAELLRDMPAECDATALADTFHFRLDGEVFAALARDCPEVWAYYCQRFPAGCLDEAKNRLRRDRGAARASGSQPLFAVAVGEVARSPVVDIGDGADIVAAAARMADFGVGSILVRDTAGAAVGIVTDRDFRYKVLARGGDMTRPVREIMSGPVAAVDHRETCFGALSLMIKRRIHHLAVTRDGDIAGMVTSHDILALQGRSPFSLFSDIEAARDVPSLAVLCDRMPRTARALLEDGAGAAHVGRMLSMLWDAVLERVLTLIQGELGPPPAPFCWLAIGEAGRMEQAPGGPPDGVVVHQDPPPEEAARCRDYFSGFSRMALDHVRGLARCGGPPPGPGVPHSLSYAEWTAYFAGHAADPRPESAAWAFALCDARPVFGYLDLGRRLCREFRDRAGRDAGFARRLLGTILPDRPPLAVYGGQVVDADGSGARFFDVAARGLSPLAGLAGIFALARGLAATGTMPRLAALRDENVLAREAVSRLTAAVDYLSHLRLAHRLGQARAGRPPEEMDDLVDASRIDPLGGRILRDVFAALAEARDLATARFAPGGGPA
jgi:CBS domain-containing protein